MSKNAGAARLTGLKQLARACAAALVLAVAATSQAVQSPEVERGLSWLGAQVQAGGSLASESGSMARPVQAATDVLHTLAVLETPSPLLAQRIASNGDTSTESLARSAIALTHAQLSPANFVVALQQRRNNDGGFGDALGSASNPLDTAWALLAFRVSGFNDGATLKGALDYLVSKSRSDGGYAIPGQDNSVYATSYALQALVAYRDAYGLSPYISKSVSWLRGARGGSGSYGSSLYDALATIALSAATTDTTQYSQLLVALRAAQAADGSWSADPYLTSLALRALSGQGQPPTAVAQGRIAGRVIDAASRRPLPDSAIAVAGQELRTNAEGGFETSGIDPGTYPLSVSRPGYLSVQQGVAVAATVVNNLGDIEMALPAGGALLHGAVFDGASGQPLQGATVQINSGGNLLTAVTAAGGAFELGGIPASAITVTVQKAGYRSLTTAMHVSGGASYAFWPALYSESAETPVKARLYGRIIDDGSGQAIANAQVGAGGKSALSGADGRFAMTDLEPGSMQLSVAAAGYELASLNVLLAAGDNQAGDLALKSAAVSMTVFGKVIRYGSGTGIPGAVVRVQGSSHQAVTNAQGDYRIEGLIEKHLTLIVSAPGHYTQTYPVNAANFGSYRLNLQLTQAEDKGLRLSASSNLPSYEPFNEVRIAVTASNNLGTARQVIFGAIVYDSERRPIDSFPFRRLVLGQAPTDVSYTIPANASMDLESSWYSKSLPAGDYSIVVSATALDGSMLAEATVGASILPRMRIGGGLTISPPITQAGTAEPISLSALVANHGNLGYPGGPARLSVVLDQPDATAPQMSPMGMQVILGGLPLQAPRGAVLDPAGNLYVVNTATSGANAGKVFRIAPNGGSEVLATIESQQLRDIARLSDGSLRVLSSSGRIYSVTSAGLSPGFVTAGPTTAYQGMALTADASDRLFVSTTRPTVSATDEVLFRIDAGGHTELLRNGLADPSGIAAGLDGKIYVTNAKDNSISRIDSSGRVESFLASGLNGPTAILREPAGSFLVAESVNNRVLRVGVNGGIQVFATGVPAPQELAFDPSGNVMATSGTSNSVLRISPSGAVSTFSRSFGTNPVSVAYDSAGRLYAASSNGALRRRNSAGEIETLLAAGKLGNNPVEMVFGSDGALYSVASGATVLRHVPGTSTVTTHASGLSSATGLAVDSSGALLVAERAANRVSRIGAGSSRETLADSLVNSPKAVAVAADGTRYILNLSKITHIPPGGRAGVLVSSLSGGGTDLAMGPSGTPLVLVGGTQLMTLSTGGSLTLRATVPASKKFAVAADNSVYLAAQSGGTIYRLSPSNSLSTFATTSYSPIDLDVDPAGGLYAAGSDAGLHRISASGISTRIASALSATALSVTPAGLVEVLTATKLEQYNSAGQVTTLMNVSAGTHFTRAQSGALDILFHGSSQLRQYDAMGVLQRTVCGFSDLYDVEWMDGEIVLADRGLGRLSRMSPEDGVPRMFATASVDQLRYGGGVLRGIVGSTGRVLRIAADGSVVEEYSNAELTTLRGIAVNNGDVALANQNDHRVIVLASGNSLKAAYVGIATVGGVAVDSSGKVYVATGAGVVRYSADGELAELLPLSNSREVAIGPDGVLWASNGSGLYRYSDGQFISLASASSLLALSFVGDQLYAADAATLRRLSGTTLPVFAGGIKNVQALRFGADGGLYIAGGNTGLITRYDASGLRVIASGLPQMMALGVGSDGLYVSDGSSLMRIDPATGSANSLDVDLFLAFAGIAGLALDSQNRPIVVAENRSTVYRIEPPRPIAPPAPGTEVYGADVAIGPIGVDGTPRPIDLGSWVPPYAGDYSIRVLPTDGVASGEVVNSLHVGPHASGSMVADRASVAPGDAQLRINVAVQGADHAALAKADPSNLRELFTAFKLEAMGADPAGNIYFSDIHKIVKADTNGVIEDFYTPSGSLKPTITGDLPVDRQSNVYIANGLKQIVRIRPDKSTEVLATMPAIVHHLAIDSRDNLIAYVNQEPRSVYRVTQQGVTTLITSAVPRATGAMSIDGQDNLYFFDNFNTITKVSSAGEASHLLTLDGVLPYETEGVRPMAGDCANNLIVAPLVWPELGQSGEEKSLIQLSSTNGHATKVFDGLSSVHMVSDMDFLAYDRYGQAMLLWADILHTNTGRLFRLPITCGAISTDLHVVVPAGQVLGGATLAPGTPVVHEDGSQEYVWELKDINLLGRALQFDTILTDVKLGEERAVASEAFLLFRNSFSNSSIKLPLKVPKVNAAGIVTMTLATNSSSYSADTPVSIDLTLASTGAAAQGRVRLDLFDAGGGLVQTLIDESHSIASGAPVVLTPPLNTGTYQAGNYQLKATFTDEAGNLQAKADASFGILASGGEPGEASAIKVVPATGKAVYGEFDAVDLLVRARSQASNFSYENLTLRLAVLNPQGSLVHSDSRVIAQLRPGAMVELPGRYQLPGAALGTYSLHAEVLNADGTVLAQGSGAFEVRADDAAKLSGSVLVGTKSPYLGDAQSCRDTVANGGARPLNGLSLRRRIVELQGNRLVSEELAQISVDAGGSQLLNRSFSTAGFALGNHSCVLEAQVNGQWKTLGYDSFKVQDAPLQLAGTVVASVDPVPQGETQTCRDTVRNTGQRQASGIPVRRVVMQTSPERRLREDNGSISLPPGGEQIDTRVFGTEGFILGPHACVLEAELNGQWQTLAYDPFVIDPPPVRVTATMERGNRGRLLVLMDGAKVNGSSKSEPEPAQQRQFLETLLTREGWSYTIVTDPEAFTWELRSGGYNVYALFSESAKLSERAQMELREATYRGEGLLEAGAHDQRHHNFDDALGVKYQGKASQVTGVEVQATEPGPTGYADLALRDKPLKAQLNSASSLGRYLGSKGSDPSAVATRGYGRGRSVYLGYDLLAEATLAGSNSLHAQLLVRSLAYLQPDYGQIAAGRVIPLRIRLENEAKPATGTLTLAMPSGASVVDKGSATVNNGVLTWAVDLAQDEDKTFVAWLRLPDAGGAVSFTAQLKIGSSVHTTASLSMNPVATGGLTDALALARPITAFKQVTNWLDKADVALRAGDADTALSHLAKASDELLKVQHASAHDLRLMIDQALLDAGRRLWNG